MRKGRVTNSQILFRSAVRIKTPTKKGLYKKILKKELEDVSGYNLKFDADSDLDPDSTQSLHMLKGQSFFDFFLLIHSSASIHCLSFLSASQVS
jgi:hypothetical protein